MTTQNACDADRICGDLTITPMWCPIGFYAESNDCLQCPKDTFCWPDADGVDESGAATLGAGNGLWGECDSNFKCTLEAYSPKPYDSDFASVQLGSDDYNGPVFEGYYVETNDDGTTEALPCPVGTFKIGLYGASCLDCFSGFYCPDVGTSELTSYSCDAGYYCVEGATVSNPEDPECAAEDVECVQTGYLCPEGYFCEQGTTHPMACQKGFYVEGTGNSICTNCPEGNYCDYNANIITVKQTCIEGSDCSGGNTH